MGFMRKADFELYRDADKHYNQVLTTRDFLALGVGTIISTSIFFILLCSTVRVVFTF